MSNTNVNAGTDVYSRVTQQIIDSLENANPWSRPWTTANDIPRNAWSGKPYRGVNVLALWATAITKNYTSSLWGTFRQWKELGANVRIGEKSAQIVFWKFIDRERSIDEMASDENDSDTHRSILARGFPVFNAAQVDGFHPIETELPVTTPLDVLVSDFVAAQSADIRHGGNRAFYNAVGDYIQLPLKAQFRDETSYFSTLAHELTHWTGAGSRLNRDLKGRFGSDAYAMEELVAELGAAFVCASLGICAEPRLDHGSYIASWLKVLKADNRAVFSAASKAQEASDWMHARRLAQQLAA